MCDGAAVVAFEATQRQGRVRHSVSALRVLQSPPAAIPRTTAGDGLSPAQQTRTSTMDTIGSVTRRDDGRYEGELRTLSIRTEIAIVPVGDKASPS